MIRTAILGAGIGREHLQGYRALPDLFEVAAICDLDLARAREIAGDIAVTDRLEAVLSDPSIDLVDICLPPHLHVPVAVQALASDKQVICEKPVATSLAEVAQLEQAEARSAGQIFPVFQYRYGRAMDQLIALDQAGLLGTPHAASLETHWARDSAYYTVPWRGTWQGEQGGAIVGHAIHAHDLLYCLFGPVSSVSARLATRINPIETEDTAALSFQMVNGALACSSITLGAAIDETRIRFVYEHLTATSGSSPYAPMDQDWQFQARDPAQQDQVNSTLAKVHTSHAGFAGYLSDVAKAIHGQSHRAVTLHDGRQSIALITALYASARADGGAVNLPIPQDHPLFDGWQPQDLTASPKS